MELLNISLESLSKSLDLSTAVGTFCTKELTDGDGRFVVQA